MRSWSSFDMEFRPDYFAPGREPAVGRWVNLVVWTHSHCVIAPDSCLQARKEGGRIHYRFWVDVRGIMEEQPIVARLPLHFSGEPLTFAQLIHLMDETVVDWGGGDDPPPTKGLAFAMHCDLGKVESDLYPQLAEYVESICQDWQPPQWWLERHGEEAADHWPGYTDPDMEEEDAPADEEELEEDGDSEGATEAPPVPAPPRRKYEARPDGTTAFPAIDWDAAHCPECGFPEVGQYLYGRFDEGLRKARAPGGLFRDGGCCINGRSPHYYCLRCGFEWRRGEGLRPGVDVRNYRPSEEMTEEERERYLVKTGAKRPEPAHGAILELARRSGPRDEADRPERKVVTLSELARIVREQNLKVTSMVVDDDEEED